MHMCSRVSSGDMQISHELQDATYVIPALHHDLRSATLNKAIATALTEVSIAQSSKHTPAEQL